MTTAIFSMPPFALWLRGPAAIAHWLRSNQCAKYPLGPHRGQRVTRLFAVYKLDASGRYEAYAIQVLEWSDARIDAIHTFLDPSLFRQFGVPRALPGATA